jgi:ribosome-associated translation inhibitor RaiA
MEEHAVIVQVHTSPDVEGGERLSTTEVEALVTSAVGRFADRISRVQVHLDDQNSSAKGGGNDKRCMIEARIDGAAPVAVTELAATIEQAVNGAADKLERSIDSHLGRQRDK